MLALQNLKQLSQVGRFIFISKLHKTQRFVVHRAGLNRLLNWYCKCNISAAWGSGEQPSSPGSTRTAALSGLSPNTATGIKATTNASFIKFAL